MARARESLIDLSATPYYHCINRCIRRSFLCGDDVYSGNNFDHRRTWLVDRIKFLSTVFSIDIAAYAIMSNHYHLVLKVNREEALNLTNDEVIERWYQLYHGCILVDRYKSGEELNSAYMYRINEIIDEWRARLYDISWFMRNLNEFIARKANSEDNCTGKFWEGRFKSQALLDEPAILSCMMYVDLNPIRAKMADSLLESEFTSIQERRKQYQSFKKQTCKLKKSNKKPEFTVLQQPKSLLELGCSIDKNTIPFTLIDYLALADFSSRLIVPNKRGRVVKEKPKILEVLNIEIESWLSTIQHFRRHYANFAGSKSSLMQYAHSHNHSWYKGTA
ncbi:transposase [Pseudoalteromonas sp. C2R02]|uniref:transposase n=1 Tax=Pseudoalteromonas sp. C2R02 TaxID=2841565 RepID=UPI001C08E94A|nr:transposase [Pseudoalteromonas sp. C2R02]MBU2971341.1 transposase [Pseudoalteromonas sp. C2R02]